MKLWKIALGTLVTGAMAGGIAYVMKLKRTGAELEAIPTAMIHRLGVKGLILRIDVLMKNPTGGTLKIKFPFLKMIYKGSTIGSSQVIDKDITLPAFGEAQISKIMISIPVTNILSVAGALIRALLQKQRVNVDVKTITTIDLGWKKFPFEKTDTITIGKSPADQKQVTQTTSSLKRQ